MEMPLSIVAVNRVAVDGGGKTKTKANYHDCGKQTVPP